MEYVVERGDLNSVKDVTSTRTGFNSPNECNIVLVNFYCCKYQTLKRVL